MPTVNIINHVSACSIMYKLLLICALMAVVVAMSSAKVLYNPYQGYGYGVQSLFPFNNNGFALNSGFGFNNVLGNFGVGAGYKGYYGY